MTKTRPIKILLIVAALLTGLTFAKAQTVPVADCCSQLIEIKRDYARVSLILDSTRAIQARVIGKLDADLVKAVSEGNKRITALSTRNADLLTKNETLAANLDEANSQLETTRKALAKHVPRTWFGRTRVKVTKGVHIVGYVTTSLLIFAIFK